MTDGGPGIQIRHRVRTTINLLQRTVRLYTFHSSPKAWTALLRHAAGKAMGRPAPRFLDIALTYRCQCRCVHCSATSQKGGVEEELTTSELKTVMDDAARMGVLEVIFSGGEPLLREDLAELVRHAHDAGLLIRLNTNGVGLDRQRVAELKRAGVTQCAVSIDDADPAAHDRLRGLPGVHAKAMMGIRLLRESGIPCQILTYASKENISGGLELIISLGRKAGAFAVFIFFPMAVGRWDAAYEQVLTEAEREQVRGLQDLSLAHVELPTRDTQCCSYAGAVLHVTARGDVTPCPFVPYALGNIREVRLEQVWRGYLAGMNLECRGDCPMNFPEKREQLKRYAEACRSEAGIRS